MHTHPKYCRRFIAAVMALLVVAVTSHVQASPVPQTITIGVVPSLDNLPYFYAQLQGYYKDAGLLVKFETTDAGASLITNVINGTYTAAGSSWFPVAIAASKGAKLKIIFATGIIKKPGYGEGGLITKPGSGIANYKDLDGKTVATNALTSLTTLATKMQVAKEGANPDSVKFVSLPFKAAVQATARGQVDAAVVVTPFEAEAQLSGLWLVADPIQEAFPAGSPVAVIVTSAATARKDKASFAAFTKATLRAAAELRANEALQRTLAEKVMGIRPDVAEKVQLPDIATEYPIDLSLLQHELDVAYKWGYLGHRLKAKDLVVNE